MVMNFDKKLLNVLRKSMNDIMIRDFVCKGESAKFIEDSMLDPEDLVYLCRDITVEFGLKMTDGKRTPQFWRLSVFKDKAATHEIKDFSVGDLREMASVGQWSSNVFTEIEQK